MNNQNSFETVKDSKHKSIKIRTRVKITQTARRRMYILSVYVPSVHAHAAILHSPSAGPQSARNTAKNTQPLISASEIQADCSATVLRRKQRSIPTAVYNTTKRDIQYSYMDDWFPVAHGWGSQWRRRRARLSSK